MSAEFEDEMREAADAYAKGEKFNGCNIEHKVAASWDFTHGYRAALTSALVSQMAEALVATQETTPEQYGPMCFDALAAYHKAREASEGMGG